MGAEERALLLDAFDSNWIAPLGPHVDAFESDVARYVDVAGAAALSSGTAALHLALDLLGVGAGDTVIVSTLTFVASANVVRYVGATPVFIDSDRSTWTMDPELLEQELRTRARAGDLPAAVIAVDLYGQCADYDRLLAVCGQYDVPLIQDAAEALGAFYRGRRAGGQGLMGVLSFNGNKIVTTSGGGMLLSDRTDLTDQARHLASQARDPAPHYEHSRVGYNYRLSNLLAAVGRGQLRSLDARVASRRATNAFYRRELGGLPGVEFMAEAPYGEATFWLTCAVVDGEEFGADRDAILEHMGANQIEARPVWKPMHLQPLFSGCRVVGGAVSEDLFRRGLCLPSGSGLTPEQRGTIASVFRTTPDSKATG